MNQHAKRRYQAGLRGAAPDPAPPPPPPPPAAPASPPLVGAARFEVGAEAAGVRLDRFLADSGTGLSRTRLQALVEAGCARLDGAPVADARVKLRAGQVVTLDVPPASEPIPAGEAIPLVVVFEDSHLIVIDKPAGLVVHPSAGHEAGTLVNALIAHCGDSLSGVGGVRRPGIVHRIDKDTSGLLVVAKTDQAHQGLAALFADHGRTLPLEREYVAFLWGAPERAAGTIEEPIGRHPHHREKQAVVAAETGREAVTHYETLRAFGVDRDGRPLASKLRCALETGRTHQIRVHLAHLGHPVIGDPLYATGFRTKAALLAPPARDLVGALRRQALHAQTLGFEHPVTGAWLRFQSRLPADLAALEKALGRIGAKS